MILRILTLLILISETVSLMCYQCVDTTADTGKSQCAKWVRTMNKYREFHLKTGRIDIPYVKNCSGFQGLPDARIYCSIMKVELGGKVQTYMRGCSDGIDFFSADYNSDVNRYVENDNQTYCIYTGQGYVPCAQICQTDFCNGFVSVASEVTSSTFLFTLSVFIALFKRYLDSKID